MDSLLPELKSKSSLKDLKNLAAIGLLTVVLLCLAIIGYRVLLGVMLMVSPKYSANHLIGRTSAQVVQELGSPFFDPRDLPADGRWKNERQDGPLVLGYGDGRFVYCTITFKNDVVVAVNRGWGD